MNRARILRAALSAGVASVLGFGTSALAEPSADQVLTDFGLSQRDKERVLHGDYVSVKIESVSEHDLTFDTVFMCRLSPDQLGKDILAGLLLNHDPQVQAHGTLRAPGSLADLAALQTTTDEAKALSKVEAGERVNFSAAEIAAFRADPSGRVRDVQQQLQRTLLARYQAYRRSGLDGIAPYDRGGGHVSNVASDLKMAGQAMTALRKYVPALHEILLSYPKATPTDIQEQFVWSKSNIRGKATYVLTHILVAAGGAARAVVRREFYVSAGYNAEQAVAGLLPVEGGTVVVYADHAFTDQVGGTGSSIKRSIGSRVLADTLKAMFDAGRRRIEQSSTRVP